MKIFRVGIAAAGLLGILAMFLPWVSEGGFSIKAWDFRVEDALKTYLPLGGFALAVLMALLATAQGGFARFHAFVALVGFALAMATKEVRIGFTGEGPIQTAIGGKLLFVAAALGLLFALIGVIKPEKP